MSEFFFTFGFQGLVHFRRPLSCLYCATLFSVQFLNFFRCLAFPVSPPVATPIALASSPEWYSLRQLMFFAFFFLLPDLEDLFALFGPFRADFKRLRLILMFFFRVFLEAFSRRASDSHGRECPFFSRPTLVWWWLLVPKFGS